MMDEVKKRFGTYERQRLFRILLDLKASNQNTNWSSMAAEISEYRKVEFQRINFYRLKNDELGDANIEIIVSWLTAKHEPNIRDKLKPQAIFDEIGVTSRDYYFHIPAANYVEEWDAEILEYYSGVYMCAPAYDRNTFIPLPILKRWFEDNSLYPYMEPKGRSRDMLQYISERSILILQRSSKSFFNAAEFPLSLLFPNSFVTLDPRMVYEGIGIVSSNSIHVQLRECLSRVPKTHSILISEKAAPQNNNPFGMRIQLPPTTEKVRQEWAGFTDGAMAHLRNQYAHSIESDYYLEGPAQISVSPLPNLNNKVRMMFANQLVYHKKPAGFLRDSKAHFIRPDLENIAEIEKILANPLSMGEIL